MNCSPTVSENKEIANPSLLCDSLTNAKRRQLKVAVDSVRAVAVPAPNSPPRASGEVSTDPVAMKFDATELHWIWKETTGKLERFARDVRENKRVLEAADFARWFQFSGILKLF